MTNCIKLSGKAFTVCEDLRQLAEQNKGVTVDEYLKEQRKNRLEQAIAKQFGLTVAEYRREIARKR